MAENLTTRFTETDTVFEIDRRDSKNRLTGGIRVAFEDVDRTLKPHVEGELHIETDDQFYTVGHVLSREEAIALRDFLNKVYPA